MLTWCSAKEQSKLQQIVFHLWDKLLLLFVCEARSQIFQWKYLVNGEDCWWWALYIALINMMAKRWKEKRVHEAWIVSLIWIEFQWNIQHFPIFKYYGRKTFRWEEWNNNNNFQNVLNLNSWTVSKVIRQKQQKKNKIK